jgi:hypothetical protein
VPANPAGFVPFGAEARAAPLAATTADQQAPPADFLPVVLFSEAGALSNAATVAPAAASIELAISGLPGARVSVSVAWTRADDSEEIQAAQAFTIAVSRIDDPAAIVTLALDAPAAGDTALVSTRAAAADGVPVPNSPFANTLTLTAGP